MLALLLFRKHLRESPAAVSRVSNILSDDTSVSPLGAIDAGALQLLGRLC